MEEREGGRELGEGDRQKERLAHEPSTTKSIVTELLAKSLDMILRNSGDAVSPAFAILSDEPLSENRVAFVPAALTMLYVNTSPTSTSTVESVANAVFAAEVGAR